VAHGAKRPICNHPECDKAVKLAGFCSTHGPARKGCDEAGCSRVAVQGGKCVSHGAKRSLCKYASDDQLCTKFAIMGGYCKQHYDSLVEEASLLNNLFNSSAESASGEEEEDAQSDIQSDAHSNHSASNHSSLDDGPMSDGQMKSETDLPTHSMMDEGTYELERGREVEEEKAEAQAKAEAKLKILQEKYAPANSMGSWGGAIAVPRLPPKSCNPDPKPYHNPNPVPHHMNHYEEPYPQVEKPDSHSSSSMHEPQTHIEATGLYSNPIVASSRETWKTPDDIQSAPLQPALMMSNSMSSNDSPSDKKKRKDRTGHPKLNQVAVDYLRAWLLSKQHVEQPYPTEQTYAELGRATGLEKQQLKNWFVNNRRRLWRPMMNELRQRHDLTDRDPLPQAVLDTLDDAPPPPYGPPAYRPNSAAYQPHPAVFHPHQPSAPVSSVDASFQLIDPTMAAADSVAAAAMMLMTGSSRATSPSTHEDSKDIVAGANDAPAKDQHEAMEQDASNELDLLPATTESTEEKSSPSNESQSHDETKRTPPPRSYYTFVPNAQYKPSKEQVKFNVGGTVVQVPCEILLKHSKSKLASMARSAMRAGDGAIPIVPRDYGMFSHCVFYLCNDKVKLPFFIRQNDFIQEMKYFGLPFVESSISGGGCAGPSNSTSKPKSFASHSRQISPTTVTQLYTRAKAPLHRPGLRTGSSIRQAHVPGMKEATVGAAIKPSSPLDLLSSAISSTTSSSRSNANEGAFVQQPQNVRKAMCGRCEACLRGDCGECKECLDKPKFGGKNKLRKKCAKRRCPNMVPHSFVSKLKSPKAGAMEKPKSSPAVERKVSAPNLSVITAEKRWSENLAFVRPCIEDGGLINYLTIPDEEVRNRVKNFVKEQRKSYRRRESKEPTSMTDERLKLLVDANFPFVFKPYVKKQAVVPPPTTTAAAAFASIEDPVKKPTSSLDLLCSITSQSFAQSSLWCGDDAIDNEETHKEEEEEEEESLPPTPSPEKTARTISRARGPNCGECEACLRDDCGECRACLDKRKFGGPNTMKRRCLQRHCVCRPQQDQPGEKSLAIKKGGSRSEEAMMKAELAKIRAELDAKARGIEYGFKVPGVPDRRSSRTVDSLLSEESEDEDDDEVMESEDEDEVMESDEEEDGDEAMEDAESAHWKKLSVANDANVELPRGVTMRPSGKWQVQLYYAGNSRYIGLFDGRAEAAAAYEVARECCRRFKELDPTPEQVKRNLDLMRKAAFSARVYSEESMQEQSKQKNTAQDKSTRSSVPRKKKKNDAAVMKAELAKVQAELDAKARRANYGAKAAVGTKPTSVSQPSANDAKLQKKVKRDVVMEDDAESRKRKFNSEIYERAKTLAAALPRGITVRPSGKWQVQLYYAGKSRYIGVFDSKLDAAVAYELARECFSSFKDDDPSPEQAKKNVLFMRKAAFSFQKPKSSNKKQKISVDDSPTTACGSSPKRASQRPRCASRRAVEEDKSEGGVSVPTKPRIELDTKTRRSSDRLPKVAANKNAKEALPPPPVPVRSVPAASKATSAVAQQLPGVAANGNIKELPELGPGWKVSIVPRRTGERADYYYFSPAGERFRSMKEAKANAETELLQDVRDQESSSFDQESSSDEGPTSIKNKFGVGYKFRKQFADESGMNLGWFDGEVVDILTSTDSYKCLYAVDGFIEDLNLAELKELAQLESKSFVTMDPDMKDAIELGGIGYEFQKQFPGGKWFTGVVVKVLKDVDNGKDRRCHYPEDDDFEDLSMADLQKLAKLEENKGEEDDVEQAQHNDLCETCGKVGELLCCSTCNLVFHLGCTRPKLDQVPDDDWSCAFCIASGDVIKNTSKEEQQKARLAVREIEVLKVEARKKQESRRKSPRNRRNAMGKEGFEYS